MPFAVLSFGHTAAASPLGSGSDSRSSSARILRTSSASFRSSCSFSSAVGKFLISRMQIISEAEMSVKTKKVLYYHADLDITDKVLVALDKIAN